jgi:hypothetical protein
MEYIMKRIAIPVLAVLAVAVAATWMMRSQPAVVDIAADATAMMPIREMHAKIDVAKLPVDEFEDQALVFTSPAKH